MGCSTDAYHTQIKDEEVNRIKKSVVYNIVGIDMEGRKSLVSYYIYFGSDVLHPIFVDTF